MRFGKGLNIRKPVVLSSGLTNKTQAQRATTLSMLYLEVLAIAIALNTWAPYLSRKRVTIYSDRLLVIMALKQCLSRTEGVLSIIRATISISTNIHFPFSLKTHIRPT